MVVLDASALLPLLVDRGSETVAVQDALGERGGDPSSVYLVDLEVAQTLRRWVHRHELGAQSAARALADLAALKLTRFPHAVLFDRIWSLRENLTAYDAAYLALAEALEQPLLTRDGAFATVPGHGVEVVVLR